jgi:hypothetical protein
MRQYRKYKPNPRWQQVVERYLYTWNAESKDGKILVRWGL